MAPIRDRWSLAPTPAGRMPHRATRMWTAMRQAALYGWAAPARSETIHVDPRHIRARITPQLGRQLVRTTGHEGGVIVDGDWDLERVTSREFTTTPVYRSCHAHWVEGVPWEETESVRMDLDRLADGTCHDFDGVEQLIARHDRLDRIFEEVVERWGLSRRYEDLVRISIARDHTLLWGPDGGHRIAMALIANLTRIPARVGYIHNQALPYFQTLRTPQPSGRRPFVMPGARGIATLPPPPSTERRGTTIESTGLGASDRVA